LKTLEDKMKKLPVLALAFSVVTIGIPVVAHEKPQETKQDEKKPALMDIKENPGMS
jgi:hypothetical protein